jgi:predicted enzyme related to lactoylglutathione lyase
MAKIAYTQLWVHDQDEALAWYTEKLDWEVREDVTVPELGNFRWLAVGPKGDSGISVVLMDIPAEPVMDPDTHAAVKEVAAKGFAGAVFLTTDDINADYEAMSARGVEFSEPPTERPYGIDTGFRDISGNHFRLTQQVSVLA